MHDPPPLDYHTMSKRTKLNNLLKGLSGISELRIKVEMSSVGTGTNLMTGLSNLSITSCNILLSDIGVTDIVAGNS